MLAGDVDTGKTVLLDYINATVGFAELGAATGKSPKGLMRMLGPGGNPQTRDLFEVVAYLQERARFCLTTRATEAAPDVRAPGVAEEVRRNKAKPHCTESTVSSATAYPEPHVVAEGRNATGAPGFSEAAPRVDSSARRRGHRP